MEGAFQRYLDAREFEEEFYMYHFSALTFPFGGPEINILKSGRLSRLVVNFLAKTGIKVTDNIDIQFGRTNNQIYHAFRHIDALRLDRSLVQSSIQEHFKTVFSKVVAGKPFNQIIEIGEHRIQYTAFKLSDGTFNIGRIHGVN